MSTSLCPLSESARSPSHGHSAASCGSVEPPFRTARAGERTLADLESASLPTAGNHSRVRADPARCQRRGGEDRRAVQVPPRTQSGSSPPSDTVEIPMDFLAEVRLGANDAPSWLVVRRRPRSSLTRVHPSSRSLATSADHRDLHTSEDEQHGSLLAPNGGAARGSLLTIGHTPRFAASADT